MMKKYTWVFPFIGGIIPIIGLVTPVASLYNYFSIWMWGLVFSRLFGISVEFIREEVILITGISSSIIILSFSLILVITGFLYKRGHFDNRKVSKLWISCGIIILISTIVSLVTLDFYTYEGYFPSGIWVICDPGFGAIGPIIGSILAIGIGIMVLLSKAGKRQKIIPISAVTPKSVCPHCGKPVSLNATFCSKCGKTIETNIL